MPRDKSHPGEFQPFRLPELAGTADDDAREAEAPSPPSRPEPAATEEPTSEPVPRPFRPSPLDPDPLAPDGGTASSPVAAPEDRAARILAAAREEAEGLVARAREEAEALRDAARREGLEAGRREGLGRLEDEAVRVAELVGELAEYKSGLYQEARAQTVELALALVGKILGPLGEAGEQVVVQVTERALQLLSDRENLTLRVHPDDLKGLVEAKPRLLETFDGIQKLTVVEDPSVRRGGCIVQTPAAEIDARLDTQLQELARAVRSP